VRVLALGAAVFATMRCASVYKLVLREAAEQLRGTE